MIEIGIRKIKMFISVVEQKSFSKAAEKLYISQPAITIAVNQIEDYFKFNLFERSTNNSRRAYLTGEGQKIFKIFNDFMVSYNEMIKHVEMNMNGIENKINIFIENNSLAVLNANFFNFLNNSKINERVEIFVNKREIMLEEISKQDNSVGITIGNPTNDNIDFIPISHIPVGIISKPHICNIKHWSDIGKESFFVADIDPRMRENLENILKSRGISMDNAVMVDDMTVFTELIANGPFMGITPQFNFSHSRYALSFTKLTQPSLSIDFGMVVKKGRLNSRNVNNFVSDIRTLTANEEVAI